MITTPCGKTSTRQGNPYTQDKLDQHISVCAHHECAEVRRNKKRTDRAKKQLKSGVIPTVSNPGPLGVLGNDMPDGAFWAMFEEVYKMNSGDLR